MASLTSFKVFDRKPAKIKALLLTKEDIGLVTGGNYTFNGVVIPVANSAGAVAGDYIVQLTDGTYSVVKQHIFVAGYFA